MTSESTMTVTTTSSTTVKKPIAIVVAALLPSFGIGHKNALPWRLRQEMKYFKQLTTQSTLEEGQLNAVVMGRKTWESIPIKFRPLPGRINAVVTRSLGDSPTEEERGGATFYGSVESALRALSQRQEVARIFIIGGAEIYRHCLTNGLVDRLFITEIEHRLEEQLPMDTFLDAHYIKDNFTRASHAQLEKETAMEVAKEVEEGDFRYKYALYLRK